MKNNKINPNPKLNSSKRRATFGDHKRASLSPPAPGCQPPGPCAELGAASARLRRIGGARPPPGLGLALFAPCWPRLDTGTTGGERPREPQHPAGPPVRGAAERGGGRAPFPPTGEPGAVHKRSSEMQFGLPRSRRSNSPGHPRSALLVCTEREPPPVAEGLRFALLSAPLSAPLYSILLVC